MKKLLLILLFVPFIGFGQVLGSISSLTISPVNPNNTDGCPLDMKSHSVLGNNIVASTQHCIGIAAAICNTTDTFKLNPLAVGTYTFDLTLSSGAGGPPCTAGIVADDNDVITFNVDNSVGIEEQTTKKELLRTTDLLGRETTDIKNEVLFYIYDDGTVEKRIVIE